MIKLLKQSIKILKKLWCKEQLQANKNLSSLKSDLNTINSIIFLYQLTSIWKITILSNNLFTLVFYII
jgi:hypothetical protein